MVENVILVAMMGVGDNEEKRREMVIKLYRAENVRAYVIWRSLTAR